MLFLPAALGAASLLLSGDLRLAPASPYQPPPYVFSIVWSVLYLLVGYSSYRVNNVGKLPTEYFVQLFLNFTWSIVYTRVGVSAGLVNVSLLLVAALATLVSFYRIDKTAAYVFLPYVVWICFAVFLNVDVKCRENKK